MSVPRRIVRPFRVRFDEATPAGVLRTSAYVRYMQDVAWVHSISAGFDLAWYASRRRFWVVRCLDLQIHGIPSHSDVLDVSTEVVAFRRIWARRVSDFRRPDGGLVASGLVDWVMTDGQGAPVRVPDELLHVFDAPGGELRPARVQLDAAPPDAVTLTFGVRPQELDPMGHVNNAAYVDWLDEAIGAAGDGASTELAARHYALEYLTPAGPGARLIGRVWPADGGWAYRLDGEDGTEVLRARFLR